MQFLGSKISAHTNVKAMGHCRGLQGTTFRIWAQKAASGLFLKVKSWK